MKLRRLASSSLLAAGCGQSTRRRAGRHRLVDDRAHQRRSRAVGGQPRRRLGLVIDPATRAVVAEVALGPRRPPSTPTQRYEPARQAARARHPARRQQGLRRRPDRQPRLRHRRRKAHASLDARSPSAPRRSAWSRRRTARAVYVVSHEAARRHQDRSEERTRSSPRSTVAEHPWGACVSADGKSLFVSHLLLGAGVTIIDTASFTVRTTRRARRAAAGRRPRPLPNGVARGVYAVVPRPDDGRAVGAAPPARRSRRREPELDFQSTVFPTISTLDADGAAEGDRLLFTPLDDAERRRAPSTTSSPARARSPSRPTASWRSSPTARART